MASQRASRAFRRLASQAGGAPRDEEGERQEGRKGEGGRVAFTRFIPRGVRRGAPPPMTNDRSEPGLPRLIPRGPISRGGILLTGPAGSGAGGATRGRSGAD